MVDADPGIVGGENRGLCQRARDEGVDRSSVVEASTIRGDVPSSLSLSTGRYSPDVALAATAQYSDGQPGSRQEATT